MGSKILMMKWQMAVLLRNTKLQKLHLNGNNLQAESAVKIAKTLLNAIFH